MSKEVSKSSEGFHFSDNERLFYRIHDRRMGTLLADEMTRVHDVELSSNNYGEFLFVTMSRQDDPEPGYVTFFGLGFHEGRDRWITDEWYWYRGHSRGDIEQQKIASEDAIKLLAERRAEVRAYAEKGNEQSERGKLFDIIADLTDDDAAESELDDLGDFFED